ncbi:hypothetical protein, partial [Klebsiella pneumoniae]|uniref:hypothetical protein n=1 Tax=Klebsiella pneumoniae TaxID=573 RepID=UPI00102274EB
MSSNPPIRFSHNHHLLSVKGCEAGLDVLAFEGDEALSQPFRYRIEFTTAKSASRRAWLCIAVTSTPSANSPATSSPPVTFSTCPGQSV